jgi:polysaccharide export outer membrane protein
MCRLLVVCVLLVACSGQPESRPPLRAPAPVEPAAAAAERAVLCQEPELGELTLQPGDEIALDVLGEDSLSLDSATVLPDGNVGLPLVGVWSARGKTLPQLQAELGEALGQWLRKPRVSVRPVRMASRRFTVVGMVNEPGSFPLDRPLRLLEAVALAGGIRQGLYRSSTVSLANFAHAYLARDGRALPVSFSRLFRRGDLSHDVYVQPGDVIHIPSSLDAEIFVLGEVVNPRAYSFRTSATLVQVLTHAGGLTTEALGSEVRLVRGGLGEPAAYVIDVDAILSGEAADVDMAPGDIVFVPQTALASWNEVVRQILPTLEGLARLKYLASPGDFGS